MRRRGSRWQPDRRWGPAGFAALATLVFLGAVAPAHGQGMPSVVPGAATPASGELEAVTRRLVCLCGCNLTVAACETAMTCEVARELKSEAAAKLSAGMTPAEALEAFARESGERILAEPPKRGFNLTAWVLPFLALGAGAGLVALALRRWAPTPSGELAPPPEVSPEDLERVEEEVRREG